MPPRRYRPRRRPRRRPLRRNLAYKRRLHRKPRLGKQVHLNVKRFTAGRNMTLVGTAASAGGTITFNAANNLLSLTTSATATTHYFAVSLAFCLNDIPDKTDFTTLFDLYRINCVVVRFFPIATEAATATGIGGTTSVGGWVHHITDDDDYATLTPSDVGIDEIRQYTNYRVQNIASRKPISRKVYPKISMAGAGGGGFTSAINVKRRWINCGYTDTVHYAFKAVWEIYDPAAAVSNISFKVEPVYYLSFKNIR